MSKEKSKQLANCPFCGGEAKLMRFPKCERKYVVICENEQCMASVGNYSYSKEKAIKAWNTRKPIERIIERIVERIEEEILEKLSDGGDDWFEAELINNAIESVKEEGGMND